MKRATGVIAGFAYLLLASSAAQAQVTLDVTKITCGQFLAYKVADPKHIAIWISGYYHGTKGSPVLDTQGMLQNTKSVQDYCFKHQDTLLIEAIKEVLGSLE
jgi:acid stress chaperone HdeB